eukprot:403334959
MNSQFFLNIKDPIIRRDYSIERNRTLLKSLLILTIIRMINILATVITVQQNQVSVPWTLWIQIISPVTWQLIIFGMGYLFPRCMNQLYTILIVPTNLVSLLMIFQSSPEMRGVGINILVFQFYNLIGIFLNNCWILTSFAICLNGAVMMSIYKIHLGVSDVSLHWIIIANVSICCAICYFVEKSMKMQFIQLQQIQKMNDELKTIFDKLPEGIILFDSESKKVSLANLEFKRLFQCQDLENFDCKVQSKIQDVRLKKYQIGASDQEMNNTNEGGLMLDIFQASQLEDQDICYELMINNPHCQQQVASQNLHETLPIDQNNSHTSSSFNEIVSLQQCKLFFQGEEQQMILLKNLTPLVKYEKLKVENHYYEMLTATVSHDMRTPLNAIIGLLGNLENFVHLQGKRFLPIIQSSSKFMLFLVNDLLDFFQIKNGKFKKNERLMNLRECIRELVDMFKVAANEKGIQLIFFCQDDFPNQIVVDSQRIQQVLLNLLQNALKFTFEGSITVTMRQQAITKDIVFSVQDTGIGIKEEDRQKLFTMFGKLESSRTVNTSGIGIGLTICKKIVESFGGQIYLEDQDLRKQGSTFTFFLQPGTLIKKNKSQNIQNRVSTFTSNPKLSNNKQVIHQETQQTPSNIQTSNNQFIFEESKQLDLDEIRIDTEDALIQSQQSYPNDMLSELNQQVDEDDSQDYKLHLQDLHFLTDLKIKSKISLSYQEEEPCKICSQIPKYLIVDDNIFNIVTLQTIIENLYNVTTEKAMNGLEAVQKVKARIQQSEFCQDCGNPLPRQYEIIFMDANMPVMDGLQATQEIRLQEKIFTQYNYQNSLINQKQIDYSPTYQPTNIRAQIIGVSAYDTDLFTKKCLDSGMDVFIPKPISVDIIRSIIENSY